MPKRVSPCGGGTGSALLVVIQERGADHDVRIGVGQEARQHLVDFFQACFGFEVGGRNETCAKRAGDADGLASRGM